MLRARALPPPALATDVSITPATTVENFVSPDGS
jgi:hypothetical protein